MTEKPYQRIVEHYEGCLAEHGDTHLGVDWPKAADAETRYQVMLGVIPPAELAAGVSLLDFGCGASHLYEHIRRRGLEGIRYSGLDMSKAFVELSKKKFPDVEYWQADVLDCEVELPEFDYVVLNGVFTEKRELTFAAMWDYFAATLERVYARTRCGLAFNVMSKRVDWERDDLFHVPFDALSELLVKRFSRHFRFRHDYGLYEYTTYVYRAPVRD